jgi:hypothetical protein
MGSSSIQPGGAPLAAPSAPAADSPDNPPQAQVVNGVTYRPQWDFATGGWDMVDPLGRSLYGTTVTSTAAPQPQACHLPGQEPSSPLDQFRSTAGPAMAAQQYQQDLQKALEKMVAERGPELQSLMTQLRDAQRSDAPWQDRHPVIVGVRDKIREITDQYAPSLPTPNFPTCKRDERAAGGGDGGWPGSPSTPSGMHVPLPTNGGYAADIVPTRATPFGDVGGIEFEHDAIRSGIQDAYAYDGQNTGTQTANDLERLARAGYVEIHVLSGAHGQQNSAIGQADAEQLALDKVTAQQTQDRHPGLTVKVYDATDNAQLKQFIQLQKQAAAGTLSRGATLDAVCYGRNRMSDPSGGPPVPIAGGRETKVGAAVSVGTAVATGALMIQGGLQDPNKQIGTAKVGVGFAQAGGGTAYMVGMLTDSAAVAKVGSVVNEVAGHAATPLVFLDVYRHMQQHTAGGDPRPAGEQNTEALTDGLALGGAIFSEFALPALVLQFGAKPMAEYAAEKAVPVFLGGMSQAYGIPTEYLKDWQ